MQSSFPSSDETTRAAIEEVKRILHSPDQLPRVGQLRVSYAKKKQTLESQLSSAVRTHIDETRLGLDMLFSSAQMITRIRGSFKSIDERCRDCKDLLKEFGEIQRVNTARNNLDATMRLLDNFRSIPKRAQALLDEMDENDRHIKQVYLGLRQLVRLRDKAYEQVQAYSDTFREKLARFFEVLQSAADSVEERVMENVGDCLVLCTDDRTTLVRTLEVIEMDDLAKRHVFGGLDDRSSQRTTGAALATATGSMKMPANALLLPPGGVGGVSMDMSTKLKKRSMRQKLFDQLDQSISEQFANLLKLQSEREREQREREEKDKLRALEEERERQGLAERAARDEQALIEEAARKRNTAAHKSPAKPGKPGKPDDDDDEEEEEEDGKKKPGATDSTSVSATVTAAASASASNKAAELGRATAGVTASESDKKDGSKPTVTTSGEADDEFRVISTMDSKGNLITTGGDKTAEEKKKEAKKSLLSEALVEMKSMVNDLVTVVEHLAPCCPPDYEIVRFYESRYRKWFKTTLKFHTSDPGKLTKKEMLDSVIWIDWYVKKMGELFPEAAGGAAGGVVVGATPSASSAVAAVPSSSAVSAAALDGDLERVVDECMQAFCKVTEDTITTLVDNIMKVEMKSTPEANDEGHYFTSTPSDLFYTINQQLSIVLNIGLKGKALYLVGLMLADVFTYYQNKQMAFISEVEKTEDDKFLFGASKIERNDSYFCAVINNMQQCQDNMDELKERIVDALSEEKKGDDDDLDDAPAKPEKKRKPRGDDDDDLDGDGDGDGDADEDELNTPKPKPTANSNSNSAPDKNKAGGAKKSLSYADRLEETFDDCGIGFVSAATSATDILVLVILTTLAKPMQKLFTKQWMDEPSVRDELIATLTDFLDDFQHRISRDAFLGKIVKQVMKQVVAEYCKKFTEVRPVVSPQLHEKMVQDRKEFSRFFKKYGNLVNKDIIKTELAVIELFGEIVSGDVEFISAHFTKIAERFGDKAFETMESLMAVRTDLTRQQRKEVLDAFLKAVPKSQLRLDEEAKQKTPADGEKKETRSFWDRFKRKPKFKAKPLPSQKSAADATSPTTGDSSAKEEESMSLSDFLT